MQMSLLDTAPRFDGSTFDPSSDDVRLRNLLHRVLALMIDGRWRSIQEIHALVGGSEGGVAARLRDLRKQKFGGYHVQRRACGDRSRGHFVYRVTE